jgi:hypothetical protein
VRADVLPSRIDLVSLVIKNKAIDLIFASTGLACKS